MLLMIILYIVCVFMTIVNVRRSRFQLQKQAIKRQAPRIAALLKKQAIREKIPIRQNCGRVNNSLFFSNKKLVGVVLKL